MTTTEKREATRQKNREARKLKETDARADRQLIRANLLKVLESEEATPAERLESSKLLMEVNKALGL